MVKLGEKRMLNVGHSQRVPLAVNCNAYFENALAPNFLFELPEVEGLFGVIGL
jgi:hypothetical protein